jgi:hypothetical protein
MRNFWKECFGALTGLGDRVVLTSWQAMTLTDQWPEYQLEIEKAILAITEACDAVAIEAKGATKPPASISLPREIPAILFSGGIGLACLGINWCSGGLPPPGIFRMLMPSTTVPVDNRPTKTGPGIPQPGSNW